MKSPSTLIAKPIRNISVCERCWMHKKEGNWEHVQVRNITVFLKMLLFLIGLLATVFTLKANWTIAVA